MGLMLCCPTKIKYLSLFLVAVQVFGLICFPKELFASPEPARVNAEIVSVISEKRFQRTSYRRVRLSPLQLKGRKKPNKILNLLLCVSGCTSKTRAKFYPPNLKLCPGLRVNLSTVKVGKQTYIRSLKYKGALEPASICRTSVPLPSTTPEPTSTQKPNPTPTLGDSPKPAPSKAPIPRVKLPIEVLGGAGTTERISIELTAEQVLNARKLYLLVHGLQYDDKALITINSAQSISINNANVTVLGNAKNFGGIGGGFHTLPIEISIPNGVLKSGQNTFEFIYTRKDSYQVSGFKLLENQIDDSSSGFRIIKLNLRDSNLRDILNESVFEHEDPNSWAAPEGLGDIEKARADGRNLWRGFRPNGEPYKLINHSPIGLTRREIKATCSDCHAHDGRDLKYYNYSNRSIVERAKMHGLSEDEGRRIAAYIRTLPNTPVVPHARPWNPPFQPGPGLDSKPVYEWASGAGLDAVLSDPMDLFNFIYPGAYSLNADGVKVWDVARIHEAPIRPQANISMREAPIAFQLMDWNHWLPKVHPLDAYEHEIDSIPDFRDALEWWRKKYDGSANSLRTYAAAQDYKNLMGALYGMYVAMHRLGSLYPFEKRDHTLKDAQRRYALLLLHLVKAWEVHMEFGLGDKVARATCGPRADERSWRLSLAPFNASPNMAQLEGTNEPGLVDAPFDGHAIGNNSALNFMYFSAAWYHLQLILDHGNRNPSCGVSAGAPYDWGYVMSTLKELQSPTRGSGISMMPLLYLYTAKGFQIFDTGLGVDKANNGGWHPAQVMPMYIPWFGYGNSAYQEMFWRNVSLEARGRLMRALYRVWMDRNLESSTEKYFVPVIPSEPTSYLAYLKPDSKISFYDSISFAGRVAFMLDYKAGPYDGTVAGLGAGTDLHNEIVDWAARLWPLNGDGTPADWERMRR